MYRQILTYILHPVFRTPDHGASITTKLKFVGYAWLFCFAGDIASTIIVEPVEHLILPWFHEKSVFDTLLTNRLQLQRELGKDWLPVLLLAGPLREECMFRLPLNLKRLSFAILAFLVVFRLSGDYLYPLVLNAAFYKNLLVGSAVALWVYFTFPQRLLDTLKGKSFRLFFYGSALIFGLIHINNFSEPGFSAWILYPLYVLPQIIGGLVIGSVRMRYGLLYGLLLHMLTNLPGALFS